MSIPDPQAATFFDTLLASAISGDYAQFVANATSGFRSAITPETFERVNASLRPHLAAGYTATYLDVFSDRGARVFLWKLSFQDGSDDRLAKLSVHKGYVAGFLISRAFA